MSNSSVKLKRRPTAESNRDIWFSQLKNFGERLTTLEENVALIALEVSEKTSAINDEMIMLNTEMEKVSETLGKITTSLEYLKMEIRELKKK